MMIFRFRHVELGGHTHVRVFAGKHERALGMCGRLCFRNEEWAEFKDMMYAKSPATSAFQFLPEEANRPLLTDPP